MKRLRDTFIFFMACWLLSNLWGAGGFDFEFILSSFGLIGSLPTALVGAFLFYLTYHKLPFYQRIWLFSILLMMLFSMYATWEMGSPLGFIICFLVFPFSYVITFKCLARWRLARLKGYWLAPDFNTLQWFKELMQESIASAVYVVSLFVFLVLAWWGLAVLGIDTDSVWVKVILLGVAMSVLGYLQLKRLLEAVFVLGGLGFVAYLLWQLF